MVSTTPIMAKSQMDEPIVAAACLSFPAPVAMPMRIVVPVVSPSIIPVMVCITWLPMATPATLAGSSNCPTTKRSAPPYSACSTFASRYGTANCSSTFGTLPFVKSSSLLCLMSVKIKSQRTAAEKGRIK